MKKIWELISCTLRWNFLALCHSYLTQVGCVKTECSLTKLLHIKINPLDTIPVPSHLFDAYISRPKKLFRRNCKVVWNSVWLACFAVYLENAQKYTCHGFSSLSEAAKTIVSYSDSKKSWYMLYVIKGNPDLLTLWNIPWVTLTGIKKCYCELK